MSDAHNTPYDKADSLERYQLTVLWSVFGPGLARRRRELDNEVPFWEPTPEEAVILRDESDRRDR
jgi:hypothetical protein